jgi:hypothetical protein
MNQVFARSALAVVLCASLAGTQACSSAAAPEAGDGTGSGGGGSTGGGSGGSGAMGNGACAKDQLKLLFTPMFSAYDGMHSFKVPVVVNNVDPSAVAFSASDPSMVDIAQPDPDTGIAMITVQKAGTVTIVANAGGLCGTSLLTITSATPDDWEVGSARYNNGVKLVPRGRRGPGERDAAATDGPSSTEVACTNCHGELATMGLFKTVAHTPQQTGGFSDDELKDVFRNGKIPANKESYFDFTKVMITPEMWSRIHQWDVDDDQAKGLITYLRSLTPTPQTGMRGDFGGGFMRPDGGMRRMRDGGRGGDPDATVPPPPGGDVDAGASD